MAQLVKNPPAMWDTWVRSLGWEDPMEKEKATHSSILALENSLDCVVHGVPKSRTQLVGFHFTSLPLSSLPPPSFGLRSKAGREHSHAPSAEGIKD